jgi:thiol-disulfide isomerase/thioredoxin
MYLDETELRQEMDLRGAWRKWMPRVLAGIVGVILLGAGIMKATDMELFVRQIKGYGIISQPMLVSFGAWGMIALQFTLGVGLLLFYRPKYAFPVATLLWLILLGATSWAWATGATDDCGCYGSWLKSTPKEATFENLALLLLTVSAWTSHHRARAVPTPTKRWAVAAACIIGLVMPLMFGFSISATMQSDPGLDIGKLKVYGVEDQVDLEQGAYLLVLMGTDCAHCKELLAEIDMLAEEQDVPRLIALTKDNESKRKRFVDQFMPIFPVAQIGDKEFWRLLGTGKMPRLMLVQDGRVQKIWDQTVPEKETIKTTSLLQINKRSSSDLTSQTIEKQKGS